MTTEEHLANIAADIRVIRERQEEAKKDMYQLGVILTGNGNPASGLAFRVARLESTAESHAEVQKETRREARGAVWTVLTGFAVAVLAYFFKLD